MNKSIKSFLIFLCVYLVLPFQVFPKEKPLVIKGARVLTLEGNFLGGGSIIIEDGKIKDLGLRTKIPEGARVFEAQGKWLIPGLIDVFICPTKVPKEKTKKSDYFTPEEKILEVLDSTKYSFRDRDARIYFNIHRETFKEALKSGVTTLLIIPDNTKIVSGMAGIFKLKHIFIEDSILSDAFALKIGFEKKSQIGLKSHIGIMWGIRELFLKQRDVLAKHSKKKASEDQVFTRLFSKKLPVIFNVNTEEEIARAFSLQEEFKLRSIFFGRLVCPSSYSLIAKKKIPVILSSAQAADVDEFFKSLKKMQELSIDVALYSEGNILNPLKILMSLKSWFEELEIPDEDVYRFITLNFAKLLGLSQRIGSIEKGKDADLVLLNGNPLKPMTRVEKVFIDGKIVYDFEEEKEH